MGFFFQIPNFLRLKKDHRSNRTSLQSFEHPHPLVRRVRRKARLNLGRAAVQSAYDPMTDFSETFRHVRFVPILLQKLGFGIGRAIVTVGSGDQASAIFFSTALKRRLRLPTSAVAVASARPSL